MPIVIAAGAAFVTAMVGMTMTDLGPWYRSLIQPSWAPPDAAYGAAWTAIYMFTAIAGVTAWRSATDGKAEILIGLFALNGFLNIAWSLLFFKLHRPEWALVEVVALWLSIAVLIAYVAKWSRSGSLLLVPYLLWVSFAATLNLAVVRLNAPFG